MKILFILNPSSGNTNTDKTILKIHQLAVEKDVELNFLYTTGKDDDNRIKALLRDYCPNRVVAGGGDGTVQLVARNLVGTDYLMGILPLGSANGMATVLGFLQNPSDATDLIFQSEHFIRLDMLRFNDDHLCVHLGDIGINARMVKKYDQDDAKGILGYAKFLMSSIKETPLMKYTIRTPEQVYEKAGYMLAFANGHQYGTGVKISDGKVWDGKFEICNVPKVALDEMIKAGLTALNVFVDKEMFSDVISCTEAEITIDQYTDFQIDGEYMGEVNKLKVEIVPGAVKLLVP
jgi:diacylglycerol kinase (ATP)